MHIFFNLLFINVIFSLQFPDFREFRNCIAENMKPARDSSQLKLATISIVVPPVANQTRFESHNLSNLQSLSHCFVELRPDSIIKCKNVALIPRLYEI